MGKIINRDIFGEALSDFQAGNYTEDIKTFSSIGGKDLMELSFLFRSFDEMPMIEQSALQLCKGNVLDVGCGAGAHSIYLQKKGIEIKAIDISERAIETCIKRGIKNAHVKNIWDLRNEKFDTILALMNGTGICGKMNNLGRFLDHLKSLLNLNGQILIDSSDVIYMYEDEFGDIIVPERETYYGEVSFELEYKGQFSEPFPWLFVDFDNLSSYAKNVGLQCDLVKKGYHYDYLARLTIK